MLSMSRFLLETNLLHVEYMTHGKFSINANVISLLFKIVVIITTSDAPQIRLFTTNQRSLLQGLQGGWKNALKRSTLMNENEGILKLVSNQQAEVYMAGMQELQMWTSRLRQQMVLKNGTVWYLILIVETGKQNKVQLTEHLLHAR